MSEPTELIPAVRENVFLKKDDRVVISDGMPEYLTRDEILKILSVVDNQKDYKYYVLMLLLWNTGLRVSEALNIRKEDIDFFLKNMRVLWLKRRKKQVRVIPLNDDFVYALSIYVGNMNLADKLFDFSRFQAYNRIKDYGMQALNRDISPHVFRHSFAVHYLKATNDLSGLKQLLGHANIQNTLIYTKLINTDLRENLNKAKF